MVEEIKNFVVIKYQLLPMAIQLGMISDLKK